MLVDGGLSLQPRSRALTDVDRAQRWVKAQALLRSFAEADAIALGASDWSVAPSSTELRAAVAELKVPVLAANLVCDGQAPFPPGKVVEREGRRIGLVGVTEGPVPGCEVQPPGPALKQAIAGLGPVDATVALVPLASEASVAQVVQGADVDIVVDGTGRYGASGPRAMGSGWAIGAGTRGKHLGRAELVFVPGGDGFRPVLDPAEAQAQVERLEKRLASVEQRLAQSPEGEPRTRSLQAQKERVTAELQEARAALAPAVGAHHQLRLSEVALSRDVADHAEALAWLEAVAAKLADPAATPVHTGGPRVVANRSSPWAGSDACVACHEGPAMQWAGTPHARAYATLAASGDAADAACMPCHVTGWSGTPHDFRPYPFEGATAGPTTPAEVGGLRDVQCESCHGPARAHVEAPEAVKPLRSPPEAVCQQCHDNQRDDQRFELGTYLPKVVHSAP